MGLGQYEHEEKSRDINHWRLFLQKQLINGKLILPYWLPTCDSNGKVSVPFWKRLALCKVTTKLLSITLSHFTSLHSVYYLAFFFFIFLLVSFHPLSSPPTLLKCKLLERQ